MKCVENVSTGKVLNLTDAEAHELISARKSLWVYVPRRIWKQQVRDRAHND